MSAKCLGCSRSCYDDEVVCVDEFPDGRKLLLCRNCLSVYKANGLDGKSAEDAVVFIMRAKMLNS